MKKIFTICALSLASLAKAQTFDTTIKNYAVVPIVTPFVTNWGDTTKAYYLNVTITSDNLKDNAQLHWVLFSRSLRPLLSGDVMAAGADYTNWTGDNNYPFNFVSSKLKITIK